MPAGEWDAGARPGKLTLALRELSRQAQRYLLQGKPFSCPVLWSVYQRWQAWRVGIPPGPARTYGEQNPHLLEAFEWLDMIQTQIQAARWKAER